jgi:hypothetical protein
LPIRKILYSKLLVSLGGRRGQAYATFCTRALADAGQSRIVRLISAAQSAVIRSTWSDGGCFHLVGFHLVDFPEFPAKVMALLVARIAAALLGASLIASLPAVALAQSQPEADANKAAETKSDSQQGELEDIDRASKQMTGPAASTECIWHGIRVVGSLRRDDLDAAFRQLQIYDRFGCPSAHIELAFRCFIRPTGPRDQKSGDAIFNRTREIECWVNPNSYLPAPATATAAPAPPAHPGTTNR